MKKSVSIILIILSLVGLVLNMFLFKAKDLFFISDSDIELTYQDSKFFVDAENAWKNVIELGSSHKLLQLGLVEKALTKKYKIKFLNARKNFIGTIYEIDMTYYDKTRDSTNQTEMPQNEKEYVPFPETKFNVFFGMPILLKIQNRYIIFDQKFYDNLEYEIMNSSVFKSSTYRLNW